MIVMGKDGPDRSALESMLSEYSTKQLVEEVLIAWDELTKRNDEFSELKQKIRLLELDLDERKEGIAPEIERLKLVENENTLLVEISSTNFEDQGIIEILFEIQPFRMKKWTVFKTDQTKTEVFFDNLHLNKSLPSKLFNIELEDPRKIPFQIY